MFELRLSCAQVDYEGYYYVMFGGGRITGTYFQGSGSFEMNFSGEENHWKPLSLVEHLIRARWPKHLMQKYKLWDLRFSFAKVVLENDETSWLKTFHNDYMVLPLLGKCGNQGTQIQEFYHNTMRSFAYVASKFDNSTLVILVPFSKIFF